MQMNVRFVLVGLLLLVTTLGVAKTNDKDKQAKPKAPAVIAGKTISFVTFATGAEAVKLKQEATKFFTKWKRYQVLDDPSQADLVVLLGPMPSQVSGDAFDAVLAGKPAPQAVNTAGAQSQFAVFDSAELKSAEGPLKAVWSTPMSGTDVNAAANKYKELVSGAQDKYDNGGLTYQTCYAMGMRCTH